MKTPQIFEHYLRPGNPSGLYNYCPACGAALQHSVDRQPPRPTCPACGFVQYRNPAPTVSILVTDGERVLLGRRGGPPGEGSWALPSGYIEYDDDFITAAIRESREETGLEVNIVAILQVISSFVSPDYHFLGLYLLAELQAPGQPQAGDDLVELAWFPLAGPLPPLGFEEDASVLALYRSGFSGIPV